MRIARASSLVAVAQPRPPARLVESNGAELGEQLVRAVIYVDAQVIYVDAQVIYVDGA